MYEEYINQNHFNDCYGYHFLASGIFVFTSLEDSNFLPFLALVSVVGIVISMILTYKTANWLSFFFNALPIYTFALFSFVYSISGASDYFKYAFFSLLIIYLIRLVKVGGKNNNI